MAVPHREGDDAVFRKAFEAKRERLIHQPQAREIAAVPHDRGAGIAHRLRRTALRHAAVCQLVEIGGTLRKPMCPAAEHISEDEEPSDNIGLVRIETSCPEEGRREAAQRVFRTTQRRRWGGASIGISFVRRA